MNVAFELDTDVGNCTRLALGGSKGWHRFCFGVDMAWIVSKDLKKENVFLKYNSCFSTPITSNRSVGLCIVAGHIHGRRGQNRLNWKHNRSNSERSSPWREAISPILCFLAVFVTFPRGWHLQNGTPWQSRGKRAIVVSTLWSYRRRWECEVSVCSLWSG